MKISLVKQCIKELFLKTDSVVALVSERGVGKTSVFRQCAEELGVDTMALYAAALEGPDFMGLPDKDREKGLTRYLAPQFLPTEQAIREGFFKERGLLVIEEINRVPSDTVSVLYPLLLERKINNHAIAKGWKIGVTMNPDTMNYAVGALDDAMIDRFVSIEVETNLADYIAYSLEHDPNDGVLAFLHASPESLLIVKRASESTVLQKAPTPRGWTRVQELINHCELPRPIMFELVAGTVGPEVAAEFYAFIDDPTFCVPELAKLMDDFGSVKADIERLVSLKRTDILMLLVRKCANAPVTEQQIPNLDAFLQCLPEELGAVFFRLFTEKNPILSDRLSALPGFERVQDAILSAV
jgi:hypothetical protein